MDLKSKPVTTSVPSISIKFHANVEQLEELYASDEDNAESEKTGLSETDNSPLKLLPKLVKRSTSVDITQIDASPPSDPWRFLSEIKGKITKSVEDKLTNKSRNQDEGSPLRKLNKDNSSLSDSEDLSESSISKTCGIVSTTEGAEMSSDDDTPSIEKDKKVETKIPCGLRQRFRYLKDKSSREGTISKKTVSGLYNISNERIEPAAVEEIECGVDALEEEEGESVLKRIETEIDNIRMEENVLVVQETSGDEVKNNKMVFSPVGFVDLRFRPIVVTRRSFVPFFTLVLLLLYFCLHQYSSYLAGLLTGTIVTFLLCYLQSVLDTPSKFVKTQLKQEIVEVEAAEEFQHLFKYEGWMNEFPETYNPQTYHISQTQSVFLRLQGNLLRLSHTRTKVSKRALWSEAKTKPIFTHHRLYNLEGAQVSLLPEGLAKKRHWSKKYPICLSLSRDQMKFETKVEVEETKKRVWRKKRSSTLRFSKLSEEIEDFEVESEPSRASTPSPSPEESISEVFEESENFSEDCNAMPEDEAFTTKIYLFARCDREKEDWFRRLRAASATSTSSEHNYSKLMSSCSKDSEEQWLNSLIGRILFDCLNDENFTLAVKDRIQKKLASIKLPYFIENLTITELSLGQTSPVILTSSKPSVDDRGLWVDLDVNYEGSVVLILQTKLNLMKLKQPPVTDGKGDKPAMFNSDLEDSAESSSDEDELLQEADTATTTDSSSGGKKLMKMVDKIAESKFFQAATEYRYIKKAMEGVSNTELRLKVELRELSGTLVLNVPKPPSDRIWLGFRPTPAVELSAQPIVGERNITFLRITSWIERKLLLEFEKLMVIPNMEDFIIPVMSPKLPE